MGFNESNLHYDNRLTGPMRWRNCAAAIAAATLMLAGCASSEIEKVLPGGFFKGAAVADEPLAARAAMDMLAQGGSAADAAVAAYFTLAVTYPSAASLGGGGVCMVADWDQGQVFALDFVAPRSSATDAYRATAVPANVRGMAALHARYGYLDWRTLLAPAEQIARFGEPLTRASAAAYAAGGEALLSQTEAREIFASRGALPVEGQAVPQPDLADVLAALRLNGAGSMYMGSLGDKLVQAVQQAGGSLVRQDLWNFKPIWQ
ncbi:MAG: gamma-glutamyltransferase, partial [Proteobacteria bacterium]|nr:gamma-glutamyltransferase [Pseudomonadota bacterium]